MKHSLIRSKETYTSMILKIGDGGQNSTQGIHFDDSRIHHKGANQLDKIGARILSRTPFTVKEVELEYEAPAGSSNEFVVNIKKLFLQHFLFKGVTNEFLVENPTGWVMHPFCFLNPKKAFTMLADSKHSPEIIEQGPNIGCLFYVGRKYPSTFKIVDNFIQKTMHRIKFGGHRSSSILVIKHS